MLSLAPCRLPRGRVQWQALTRSSSQRGNGHCARDSHVRHVVDTLVASVAPPLLRRLDQTRPNLSHAGDADRSFQKQARACGRKRTPPKASDHSPSTGETASLYKDGPDAPGASGKNGTNMEASAVHHSAKDEARGGIARASSSTGNTSPEPLLPHPRSLLRPGPL